jgi:tRNA dimethylallyltransferase
MNIGTAKPTIAEMSGVPHYMLDLVEPNEAFSLYNFQHFANKYIKEIRENGQIPFLVGGSGLYVDSILFAYQLGSAPDNKLRQKLNKMTIHNLLMLLKKQQIEIPSNFYNRRHLVRALEQNGINRARQSKIIDNTYVVGVTTEKAVLEQKIRERAKQMLDNGFVEEARNLIEKYGENAEPLRRSLYREVQKYLRQEISKDELLEKMVIADRQLVKKQLTWFRRNKQIEWLELDQAEKRISELLLNI